MSLVGEHDVVHVDQIAVADLVAGLGGVQAQIRDLALEDALQERGLARAAVEREVVVLEDRVAEDPLVVGVAEHAGGLLALDHVDRQPRRVGTGERDQTDGGETGQTRASAHGTSLVTIPRRAQPEADPGSHAPQVATDHSPSFSFRFRPAMLLASSRLTTLLSLPLAVTFS